MKKLTEYVNVFQGSGRLELPTPEGIAATWLFIKARCGNTSPAAAYPFGKMSVCSYTGGYPTGYGNRRPNSCGEARSFDAPVRGFSHLQVSGTGAIHAYYNFALTTPRREGLGAIAEELTEEAGEPGYYTATLSSGIKFEGTVTPFLAYHRYNLGGRGVLQIDFSKSGLSEALDDFGRSYFDRPTLSEIRIISEKRVTAHVRMRGVDLYFAAECAEARGVGLWEDYKGLKEKALIGVTDRPFGAAFYVEGSAVLRISLSFVGCDEAEAMLDREKRDFDQVRSAASDAWEAHLGRIKIDADERTLEIFYSNLYHSLIKPCSAGRESFTDGKPAESELYYDLGTLWDMYKTALPLIFTLYPDAARGITETLLTFIEKNGRSPINITLSENNDCPEQARMLSEYCFADYYYRYGAEYGERMLRATERDLEAQTDFLKDGFCERYTHILDITEALGNMADIARELGAVGLAEKFGRLSEGWQRAFGKDGLMSEKSPYYEGDRYNYSFRLMRNMEERIALMGREKFVEALDGFFGYTRSAVEQVLTPELDPLSLGLHSFEGFNNESDMEAPFAYLYAGRHDRVCEIMRAGMKYMFSRGRGGLPGNNDSGALSSLYVFSALGLFPVSGQDLMLIGSPSVNGAALTLANGKELKIRVYDNDSSHIYVKKALFNGRELTDMRMSVREMMEGGRLEFYMSREANG